MTLEEWESLDHIGRARVDAQVYLGLAQAAARELLSRELFNAQHVHLADRFGELILNVYVPDQTYAAFAPGWEQRQETFYGFRCSIEPLRRMHAGLEQQEEQYFFTRRA